MRTIEILFRDDDRFNAKKDRSRLCSMAVTVEMHNTDDPALAEVVSVIETCSQRSSWRLAGLDCRFTGQ